MNKLQKVLADARSHEFLKAVGKALRDTPRDAEWVTLKVTRTSMMKHAADRGWEVVGSVPLGASAGFVAWIVRRRRSDVLQDIFGEGTKVGAVL